MAKIFATRIKDGAYKLEDVPKRWYDQVKAILIADGYLADDEATETKTEATTETTEAE